MPPQQPTPIRRARSQIPGREILPSGTPLKFLTFSFFLFLASVLAYIGLSVGYKTFLNSEISKLEESIDELRFQISVEQQDNLVKFFSQVSNVEDLLGDHVITSNLFPILQDNTHSRVAYSDIDVSVADRKVAIDGVAETFDALVSQLTIYEATPEVERIVLRSADRAGGVIDFKIELTMVAEVFEFQLP